MPSAYDRLANNLSADQLERKMRELHERIASNVATMPSHADVRCTLLCRGTGSDGGVVSERGVNKVVVVGRDVDLWLSACCAPNGIASIWCQRHGDRAADSPPCIWMYATLPALEALHNLLRINEAELLASDSRCVLVGPELRGLLGGQAYFHAYGTYGAAIDRKGVLSTLVASTPAGRQCQSGGFLADRGRREARAYAHS